MTTHHHLDGEETNWIDLVQHKDLVFNGKVMFTYVLGGRTVICRCFNAIIVPPGAKVETIKEAIRRHLCDHSARQKKSTLLQGDMPTIPGDSTYHVKVFSSLIHPLIKDAVLILYPASD